MTGDGGRRVRRNPGLERSEQLEQLAQRLADVLGPVLGMTSLHHLERDDVLEVSVAATGSGQVTCARVSLRPARSRARPGQVRVRVHAWPVPPSRLPVAGTRAGLAELLRDRGIAEPEDPLSQALAWRLSDRFDGSSVRSADGEADLVLSLPPEPPAPPRERPAVFRYPPPPDPPDAIPFEQVLALIRDGALGTEPALVELTDELSAEDWSQLSRVGLLTPSRPQDPVEVHLRSWSYTVFPPELNPFRPGVPAWVTLHRLERAADDLDRARREGTSMAAVFGGSDPVEHAGLVRFRLPGQDGAPPGPAPEPVTLPDAGGGTGPRDVPVELGEPAERLFRTLLAIASRRPGEGGDLLAVGCRARVGDRSLHARLVLRTVTWQGRVHAHVGAWELPGGAQEQPGDAPDLTRPGVPVGASPSPWLADQLAARLAGAVGASLSSVDGHPQLVVEIGKTQEEQEWSEPSIGEHRARDDEWMGCWIVAQELARWWEPLVALASEDPADWDQLDVEISSSDAATTAHGWLALRPAPQPDRLLVWVRAWYYQPDGFDPFRRPPPDAESDRLSVPLARRLSRAVGGSPVAQGGHAASFMIRREGRPDRR